jgi:hypothetical protein
MGDFARTHPNLTDEQAVQAFQLGMQKAQQRAQQPPFQGLISNLPTGAK